jgi:hypothetical protein
VGLYGRDCAWTMAKTWSINVHRTILTGELMMRCRQIKRGVIGFVVRWCSYLIALLSSSRGFGLNIQLYRAERSSVDRRLRDSKRSRVVTKQLIFFFNATESSDMELQKRKGHGRDLHCILPRVNKRHADPFQGASMLCRPITELFPSISGFSSATFVYAALPW